MKKRMGSKILFAFCSLDAPRYTENKRVYFNQTDKQWFKPKIVTLKNNSKQWFLADADSSLVERSSEKSFYVLEFVFKINLTETIEPKKRFLARIAFSLHPPWHHLKACLPMKGCYSLYDPTWQGQRELLMCLGLVLLLYSLRPYRSSTTQSSLLLR